MTLALRCSTVILSTLEGFSGRAITMLSCARRPISFNAKDDKWHATMNANADQLKAAPRFRPPEPPAGAFLLAGLVGDLGEQF
jgi:hypothetical protein